jgi:hypothetical protein
MKSQLFIASKVKVGFNLRGDTYTGKLGYVIGFDGKKWRKEPSWDGWRLHFKDGPEMEKLKLNAYNEDIRRQTSSYESMMESLQQKPNSYSHDHWYRSEVKGGLTEFLARRVGKYEKYNPNIGRISNNKEIIPLEFDNVPTEGFVLNKKVGGYSSGWDHRSTYSRVYDPRGFEFEITMENLLFILQECNSMKGKGLEGEFVYAWNGKDLVLLPTSSEDYRASDAYTKAQQGKVSAKELEAGLTYKHKNMQDYVYLGRFPFFNNLYSGLSCKKAHVFYNITDPSRNEFVGLTALATVISKVTDTSISNFSEIFDKFNNSRHSEDLSTAKIDDYQIVRSVSDYYFRGNLEDMFIELEPNKFEVYSVIGEVSGGNNRYGRTSAPRTVNSYTLKGKVILTLEETGGFSTKPLKKEHEDLSYYQVVELAPKVLKLKTNNKINTVTF